MVNKLTNSEKEMEELMRQNAGKIVFPNLSSYTGE